MMMKMRARRERQGTGDRGDDLSLDHPNTHPGRCLFISVRKARKRLDRASWLVSCRLASPRLVSFLLDLGKLPKPDLGALANDEDPGSSLCWTICATFEIHTVELEDNHTRSLHQTIIRTPTPAHISFHASRGCLSTLCLLLRLTSIHSTTAQLLSGLPPPNP